MIWLFSLMVLGGDLTTGHILFRNVATHGQDHGSIYAIFQDHAGFIWFGNERGLNRFDGIDTKTFSHDPRNPNSISSNIILDIFEDSRQQLWVGALNGLNQMDITREQFHSFRHNPEDEQSLSDHTVRCISEGQNGTIWIGTNKGLNTYHQDKKQLLRIKSDTLSDKIIFDILPDSTGILWLATDQGLIRFDPNLNDVSLFTMPMEHAKIRSLKRDAFGHLWLGTSMGLYKFDFQTKKVSQFQPDATISKQPSISKIWIDRNGSMWTATEDQGLLYQGQNENLHTFKYDPANPYGISSNRVNSIFEDKTGVIWIGTAAGLSRIDPLSGAFNHHEIESKTGQRTSVLSIFQDKTHTWIGTSNNGIKRVRRTKKDRQTGSHSERKNLLEDRTVWDFLRISESNMLIATSNGLKQFDLKNETITNLTVDQTDIGSKRIFKLFQDDSKHIWLGTNDGLGSFDLNTEKFAHYKPVIDELAGPTHNRIWTIIQSRQGDLWLGTFGAGLMKMDPEDPGKFQVWQNDPTNPNSLSHNLVWDIHQDSQDIMWIGVKGGINRFDPGSGDFKLFGKKHGLPDNEIYSILPDEFGGLWVSTNHGLARFDIETETAVVFDFNNGLPFNEFSGQARFRNKQGKLFFGGVGGVISFFPKDIPNQTDPPPIVLTDFRIFGESIPVSQEPESLLTKNINELDHLSLPFTKDMFTLEFAAMHFAAPSKNQYAFKLENSDEDWIYTDASRRYATYTHLRPGNYTFRVKAANADGVWNESGKSLQIQILPPIYLTWWAKCLYLLAFLMLLFGLVHYFTYRKKYEYQHALNLKLKRMDKLKDDFLAKVSHELRTPLNGMIGLTETAAEQTVDHKTRQDLITASHCGRRLSGLIDNILDHTLIENQSMALRLRPVDLHSVTEVVLNLLAITAPSKKLCLENALDANLPAVIADEDRLRQILVNLISNAIKYTDSGFVRITAETRQNMLAIKVEDSGCGMSTEELKHIFKAYHRNEQAIQGQSGVGLGLAVTHELVQLHGGALTVASQPAIGSQFTFTLPISQHEPEHTSAPTLAPSFDPVTGSDPNQTTGWRILVVDDEPVNQRVIINFLEPLGYHLTLAGNGEEALLFIKEQDDFDLVLLDIMMPGMNGYETCRHIRKQHHSQQLPILFLSAKSQDPDLVAGFDAGGNDYLTKPVTKSELCARIALHLQLLDQYRNMEDKVSERTLKIRELHKEKDRFFTNISHELRTPLTLITAPIKKFLQDNSLETPQRKQLERAMRQCDHLTRLVNELLDLAKLESGRMTLNLKPTNLANLTLRCIASLASWAEQKGINLSFRNELEGTISELDPSHLEKIINNLISNAIKITSQHGKIMVSLIGKGKHAQLSVIDTGKGISPKTLPHIFDRFYQADNQTQGSGLGLALSLQLAKLHGGDISATSQEGMGSTFTLSLPIKRVFDQDPNLTGDTAQIQPESIDQNPAIQESQTNHDLPLILIVEDHSDMRTWLNEIFSAHYRVTEAENGLQALEKIKKHPIDLVISDVLMPQMDGHELCRQLKQNPETAFIPILLLTAQNASDTRIHSLEANADAWLPKPFEVNEILAQVANLLRTRRRMYQYVKNIGLMTPDHIQSESAVFIQKAIQTAEDNLGNSNWGVHELAFEMAMSERQLRRKLKLLTNQSPIHFLRGLRLERAAQLLAARSGTVSEVAQKVGFKKASYFSNLFHDRYGVLPSEYEAQANPKDISKSPS